MVLHPPLQSLVFRSLLMAFVMTTMIATPGRAEGKSPLQQAEERMRWAERMLNLGYLTPAEVEAEREAFRESKAQTVE